MTTRKLAPWLLSALSGLFLVLAFQPFDLGWLGWLALAPLWIALRTSAPMRRTPLRYGYLVGLMFILGGFWWVGAATLVGITIMAVVLSIYPALWCLILARVVGLPASNAPMPFRSILVYAFFAGALWITLEWLRGWFMKGFNWNELGISQVSYLHLRQLAAMGGVPLLSFVLATFGVLAGESILCASQSQWKRAGPVALAGMALLGSTWIYGWHRVQGAAEQPPRASIRYACIQPNIAELPYRNGDPHQILQLEIAALTRQQTMSVEAVADHPDLLIWPEAITTQRLVPHSLLRQVTDHLHAYYPGSLLLGAEEVENTKLYNTAYLFTPDQPLPQRYHKVYLVVLGEYLPWSDIFPWLTQWWGQGVAATAGTEPGYLALPSQGLHLAPLMCFEDTQPEVVSAAAGRHPDFFVTMINAGWFHGALANWCLRQHLENAVLRCVEHDRPMIRCADTGITCEIDAMGRIIAELPRTSGDPLETQGILAGRLILETWSPTLYDRWGDWAGRISRLLALGLCLISMMRGRPLLS